MSKATDVQCLIDSKDAWGCFVEATFAALPSDGMVGLLIGVPLILGLYIGSSYHPAPPTIGTILIAGLLIPFLPAQHRGSAQVIMLLGFILGVFFFLQRYVLEVGR